MQIKFGTSGWRAIIAEDFTFDTVKIVIQAIADYINETSELADRGIIVGYDTRFLSDRFAETAVSVLMANDIKCFLTDRDAPTPAISLEIIQRKTAGAVNITASHNPPEWNGIKFSPEWGGPALSQTTDEIGNRANRLIEQGYSPKVIELENGRKQGLLDLIDPRPCYFDQIKELVNFDAIRDAGLKVVIDPQYGTARGYLDVLLEEAGCDFIALHNEINPSFGGKQSIEPKAENVPELIERVVFTDAVLGLVTDGDADRFGIIDRDGTYIEASYFMAALIDYLIKTRGWESGTVVRNIPASHLIDAAVKLHKGIDLRYTPVGFKYIGEIMCEIPEKFLFGGESSSGLTIHNHIPEKDGIVAGLLAVEMVATTGKSISQLLDELYRRVGRYVFKQPNFRISEKQQNEVLERLEKNPPKKIAGKKVMETIKPSDFENWDGYKFILEDGSWFALRLSGTEPLVRCYAEASEQDEVETLISAVEDWVKGAICIE